jgi:hypothetical protein
MSEEEPGSLMPRSMDTLPKNRDWSWLPKALPLVGLGVACGTLATYGAWNLAIVFGVIDLVIASVFTYAAWQSLRAHRSSTLLWRGPMAFRAKELERLSLPGLRKKRAPFRRFIGWEIAGGQLEVRPDCLHWEAARWFPFGLLGVTRGTFEVPWMELEEVTVTDAPGTITALGGQLSISHIGDHSTLSGQFMGSQEALRDAIEKAQGTTRLNHQG